MGITKYDTINTIVSNAKVVDELPTTSADYYGYTAGQDENTEFVGGELAYLSTDDTLHVQTATSGTTASWFGLATAFATTTSTSTSTSTSTTTSSTSTTTSTSTSTSSTTSTSTSTSSTTTP